MKESKDAADKSEAVADQPESSGDHISAGREAGGYVIRNQKTGVALTMDRGGLKALCRYAMTELNIVSATLDSGEKVEEKDAKFKESVEKRAGEKPAPGSKAPGK